MIKKKRKQTELKKRSVKMKSETNVKTKLHN
jgi:hypothetical protein